MERAFPICTYDRGCAGSEQDSDIRFFLCVCGGGEIVSFHCGPTLSMGRAVSRKGKWHLGFILA